MRGVLVVATPPYLTYLQALVRAADFDIYAGTATSEEGTTPESIQPPCALVVDAEDGDGANQSLVDLWTKPDVPIVLLVPGPTLNPARDVVELVKPVDARALKLAIELARTRRGLQTSDAELAELRQRTDTESRLRAVFVQSGAGVVELDVGSGRVVRVNERYANLLGYDLDELVGVEVVRITHQDPRRHRTHAARRRAPDHDREALPPQGRLLRLGRSRRRASVGRR
jgi:PAS domain-containing protein